MCVLLALMTRLHNIQQVAEDSRGTIFDISLLFPEGENSYACTLKTFASNKNLLAWWAVPLQYLCLYGMIEMWLIINLL